MAATASRSPGRDVGGQPAVAHDDVAALAVLADHPRRARRRRRCARETSADVVLGVVERGADVVAHPAVDADVAAARCRSRHVLDRADLVEGDACPARRSPGRARPTSRGHGQPGRGALVRDDLAQLVGQVARRRRGRRRAGRRCRSRRRGRACGRRRSASTPCSRVQLREQPDDAVRGHLEARGVEDLRADVGVQADQLAARRPRAPGGPRPRRASPPASEKPNFWSSCAVAMNSWVCASTPTVTPDHHAGTVRRARGPRASSRSISCSESSTMCPTPAVDRRGQLGDGLVVAVQRDPLGREARRAARRPARRRCRRPGSGPPRRPSGRPPCTGTPWPRSAPTAPPNAAANSAAARPEVGLVDDEQRRAVPARRGRGRRRPPSATRAVVGAAGAARPHRGGQRVELGRAARVRTGGLGRRQHAGVQRTGGMSVHMIPSRSARARSHRAARVRWRAPRARRRPAPAARGAGP